MKETITAYLSWEHSRGEKVGERERQGKDARRERREKMSE